MTNNVAPIQTMRTKEKDGKPYLLVEYVGNSDELINVLRAKYISSGHKAVLDNLPPKAIELRQSQDIVTKALKNNQENERFSANEVAVLKAVQNKYNYAS